MFLFFGMRLEHFTDLPISPRLEHSRSPSWQDQTWLCQLTRPEIWTFISTFSYCFLLFDIEAISKCTTDELSNINRWRPAFSRGSSVPPSVSRPTMVRPGRLGSLSPLTGLSQSNQFRARLNIEALFISTRTRCGYLLRAIVWNNSSTHAV